MYVCVRACVRVRECWCVRACVPASVFVRACVSCGRNCQFIKAFSYFLHASSTMRPKLLVYLKLWSFFARSRSVNSTGSDEDTRA